MKHVWAFLMALLLCSWAATAQADQNFEFNTLEDEEGWVGSAHVSVLVATNSVSAGGPSVGVLSALDVTDNDPQLRHNTTIALPTGERWDSVKIRFRQLGANPPGGSPAAFNNAGTLFFCNGAVQMNTGNLTDKFFLGTGGNYASDAFDVDFFSESSNRWKLVTVDYAGAVHFQTNDITAARFDPVGQIESKNFEVDYIRFASVPEPDVLVCKDTFNSADNANPNAGIASTSRQFGIMAPTDYSHPGTYPTISNGDLLISAGGTLSLNLDLAPALTGTLYNGEKTDQFTISVRLQNRGDAWTSLYLTTHNTGAGGLRGKSRFGLMSRGATGSATSEGRVDLYYDNAGSQGVYQVQTNALTTALGVAWDQTQDHLYEMVATPSAGGSLTGTYVLKIDGVEVAGPLAYELSNGSDRAGHEGEYNLEHVGLGSLDFTYDNLAVTAVSEPLAGTVVILR